MILNNLIHSMKLDQNETRKNECVYYSINQKPYIHLVLVMPNKNGSRIFQQMQF
jgi:hypothetical protein